MNYAFITGIPAAGKSYLAAKVAESVGALHVEIDGLWREMSNDPELKKWVNFFLDQDEAVYWKNTSCDQQWENLKNQSEAFWPFVLQQIKKVQESGRPAIFEGVNILPHLARRDLSFEGIVLLGESFEKILERNKHDPRWGKTEELQVQEAKAFWNCERSQYQKEAERYKYPMFSNPEGVEKELLRIMNRSRTGQI